MLFLRVYCVIEYIDMVADVQYGGMQVTEGEIVIRCALPRDIWGIYRIRVSGYDEARVDSSFGDHVSLSRITRKQQREWFSEIMKEMGKGRAIFMVAEKKRDLIGICSVRMLDNPPTEASHVGVLSLRVRKEDRGAGIGTRLMEATLGESKGTFRMIELSMNRPAKRLYRKFGFRTWGVAPGEVRRRGKYLNRDYMYLRL